MALYRDVCSFVKCCFGEFVVVGVEVGVGFVSGVGVGVGDGVGVGVGEVMVIVGGLGSVRLK